MRSKTIHLKSNQTAKIRIGSNPRKTVTSSKHPELDAALQENSKDWVAWAKLAEAYFADQDYSSAVSCYEKVLNNAPLTASLKARIGFAYAHGNRISEAFDLINGAVKEEPDNHHHRLQLVKFYQKRQEFAKALEHYDHIQGQIAPRTMSDVNVQLGEDLRIELRKSQRQKFKNSIKKNPQDWGAWAQAAETYVAEKEIKKAIYYYSRVLENAPLTASLRSRIGVVYARGFHIKKAFELVNEAIRQEPKNQHLRLDLCRLYRYTGEYEKALKIYKDVKEIIAPKLISETNLSNESYCNLSAKNYVAGMQYLKGAWDRGTKSTALGWHKRQYKLPAWTGDDLTGRSILLNCEQGLGDGIVFLRYLSQLADKNPTKIYVALAKPLHRLLKGNPLVHEVVDRKVDPTFADVEVCSFDLPLFFKTTAETVPAPMPLYLPKSSVTRAQKILKPHRDKFNVGVLWTGNPKFPENHLRSFAIQQFLRLSDIPNIQMFSLYKGDMPKVLNTSPAKEQILDVSNSDRDLADSAAFMEQLDLIITIDSAVAHLSGSTSTPVWCLLKHLPFWYYADGKTTPWYPDMRLFTKDRPGGWAPIFKQVRTELEKFAAAHKP